MPQRQKYISRPKSLYSEDTDPALPVITAPISAQFRLRASGRSRFSRGIHAFFVSLIRAITRLFDFALVVIVLLLLARFLLSGFGIHASLFVQWINQVTAPLVFPFDHMLSPIDVQDFLVDLNTLAAIMVYIIIERICVVFLHSIFKIK